MRCVSNVGFKFVFAIAAVALSACGRNLASSPWDGSQAVNSHHASGINKIQHVVVVIQENRSLDNLFQGFPGADTRSYGYDSSGQKIKPVSYTHLDVYKRQPMALAVTGGPYIHITQIAGVLPLAFVTASRTRSKVAWAGIVLLTVPWNLLNALTPSTLVVPRAHEVMLRALAHQATAGGFAYIANVLVYLGIACTYWSVLAGRSRRLS